MAKKKHKMAKKILQHTCTVGRIESERASTEQSSKSWMGIDPRMQ